MKKITIFVGTRPEAIKLAPVIIAFRGECALECKVCVTGQHRQMLDQVLELFEIVPDADLNLMQTNQSLASLTTRPSSRSMTIWDRICPTWYSSRETRQRPFVPR